MTAVVRATKNPRALTRPDCFAGKTQGRDKELEDLREALDAALANEQAQAAAAKEAQEALAGSNLPAADFLSLKAAHVELQASHSDLLARTSDVSKIHDN